MAATPPPVAGAQSVPALDVELALVSVLAVLAGDSPVAAASLLPFVGPAGELVASPDVVRRLSVMYHPDPLKTMPAGNSTRRTAPPHAGHSVTGGSEKRCERSKRCLQAEHSYS
jgi:hypothetical protein